MGKRHADVLMRAAKRMRADVDPRWAAVAARLEWSAEWVDQDSVHYDADVAVARVFLREGGEELVHDALNGIERGPRG